MMSCGEVAGGYSDEIPMLSVVPPQQSEHMVGNLKAQNTKRPARSTSIALPPYGEFYQNECNPLYHTGPLLGRNPPIIPMSAPLNANKRSANGSLVQQKIGGNTTPATAGLGQDWPAENCVARNEHLLKSGPLGRCNDPYCTTCPTYFPQPSLQKQSKASAELQAKFHSALYGDAKGWMRRTISFLVSCVPGVMNPHNGAVQQWNKFFVISCLVAIFIDPLFFFLLSVQEANKCMVLNWPFAIKIAAVRSLTDFIYFMHMLLQFRLAYVAPESRVVGAGDLVDHPKKIALHYLKSYFILDLFIVLPLPQIMILFVLPKYVGSSSANYGKNLLRATVLLQYIPRIFRALPSLAGRSSSGFIFESAWANFIINLLVFVLSGHVVGSCWYLLGLQRVNQCLKDACDLSDITDCQDFIDCGSGNKIRDFLTRPEWANWKMDPNATSCFDTKNGFFPYGIYEQAVLLSTKQSFQKRYIYSLFWGFQQISTLAGNLVPSYFEWEVLFTMGIIGKGLLLFALLIGNMQNFLQALGRRRLDMQLRRRDFEQWMSHRRLPEYLRKKVRNSVRFSWAATRGVNEQVLLDDLPEDLQQDIRRHLFTFVKKVRIFALLETPILGAICDRLRQKLYIKGSKIFYQGGPIDNMVFIVRGSIESTGGDGSVTPLREGDVCGEELLIWYLEHSSMNRDGRSRASGYRQLSNRTITCVTNVEAFALRAADIDDVTSLFARHLRNPFFKRAIRYDSPYWRERAASYIQVIWRYRQKRLRLKNSSNPIDNGTTYGI